jgi:hypothetical protein
VKALLLAVLLASEAAVPNPWSVFRKIPVVEIVTTREDGEPRVTKIWVVVAEGRAFASAMRWSGWRDDLERDPRARVRTADFDVAATARPVTGSADLYFADELYRAKYPTYAFWSLVGLAPSHVFELVAEPSDEDP